VTTPNNWQNDEGQNQGQEWGAKAEAFGLGVVEGME